MYSFEILADTMATLLKGVPLRPAPVWVEMMSSFMMLFSIVACSMVIIDPKWRTLLVLLLFGIYIHVIICYYVYSGFVISMTYTLLSGILGYFAISLYSYIQERKFRNEISAKLHEKQNSLEKAEEKYRSIYENAAEGIFQINTDGRLISANPAMIKILGYQSSMDMIISLADVVSRLFENDKDGKEFFQKIQEHGKVVGMEKQFRQKEGNIFTGIISGRAVRDDFDNVLYYEGSLQDITERIQKEKAERDREVAEIANAAKSEFLSRMSHEIRNPLNAISLTIESVMNSNLTLKQQEALKTIQSSNRYLIRVVDEILDLSKIELGKLHLETIGFNLFSEMDFVTDLYKDSWNAKKIELILDIDPGVPPFLYGDPYRLEQVIGNLLSNAVKFTERGQIVVGVQCLQNRNESVILDIFVEDTGIGLTNEQIQGLFSPYSQAECSISRKYGGSGLGLSICKKIIELMGGQIQMESEKGKGTRVGFTAEFFTQTDNVVKAPQLLNAGETIRILVVDDNVTSLKMMDRALKSFSCEPDCVSSADSAFKKLTDGSRPYDLIIIDHEMDGTDGLSAIKTIRNNKYFPQLPIIFMSAFGNDEIMQTASKLGADVCTNKPIRFYQFFDTILQALGGYKHHEDVIRSSIAGSFITETLHGISILLVEDNSINQQVASEILNKAGMRVVIANNGEEAVQAVCQNNFDAVLMDIRMPVMDGFEASKQIRNNPKFKNLPIIAMTASSMQTEQNKCFKSGINAYIRKPIDIKNLFSILEYWVKPKTTPDPNDSETQCRVFIGDPLNSKILQKFPGINADRAVKVFSENFELYKELITQFSEKYADIPQKIRKAVWNKDLTKVDSLLHEIKSVSGFLMADTLLDVIENLEKAVLNEDIDLAQSLQVDLENAFKQILTTAMILEENKKHGQENLPGKNSLQVQQGDQNNLTKSLGDLNNLLMEHNLFASDALSDIIKNVTDPELLRLMDELAHKIDRLDFREAQRQLSGILESMGFFLPQNTIN